MVKTEIITLLTDFGTADAYVACIKGVILSINPRAVIVDISHAVPRFNIRYGAYMLMQATRHFPADTVHVAVVDPGVGTRRLPIIIETRRYIFIGPDNGVLSLAATDDGVRSVYRIENKRYMLSQPAETFAGRDIFAPVAAYIAAGIPPSNMGSELGTYEEVSIPKPIVEEKHVKGEVLTVDSFGNLITNIRLSDLMPTIKHSRRITIKVKGVSTQLPFVPSYGYVDKGETLALMGSVGFLEVAVNQGNASKRFQAEAGDLLEIFI